MQTGLEHVGCRPRRVTPTALISTSRIVFIRQDKSRAWKVVLQNIFGSWATLACTNSSLVVDPPRPHRIELPAPLANAPVKPGGSRLLCPAGQRSVRGFLSPRTSTWLNVLTTLEAVSGRCDQ